MPRTPRFETLYLHVGLDKTGTTSVQSELAARAALLESTLDIHFPTTFRQWPGFRGNHSNLLRPLFARDPRAARRLAARGLHNEEEVIAFNRQNLEDLNAGFARTRSNDLLLSAEVISHFKPVDLQGLAQWSHELAQRVVVIACIRHPVHALSSEIQQRLRIGARLENLYRNPPYYRFRELLGNLAGAFGSEALRLYSFHRAVEHPKGLAAALLQECGRSAASGFEKQLPANVSMSAEAAVMLSAYNAQRPAFILGQRNPARSQAAVQRLAALPGDTYLAPADVLDRTRDVAAKELDWLQERYGLDLSHPPVPAGTPDPRVGDAQLGPVALELAQQAGTQVE